MIKNIFLHLNTINKHRFKVFKLCVKAGIPYRGLVHDLSKYSITEFFEGVKYYSGDHSPIQNAKQDLGYSKAWLHHKGHNKHHPIYWYDPNAPVKTPIIPYKFVVEMICDTIAAGMTYEGKNWSIDYQIEYHKKESKNIKINPKIDAVVCEVYEKIKNDGIDNALKPKELKKIYIKHVN